MARWMSWILEETAEFEAPSSFFLWSTFAAVSAVLKDNVYVKMKRGLKLYPNIYVILYAPSGLRKGMPINIAKRLAQGVENTRVIPGRFSIQALVNELSRSQLDEENQVAITDSAGFVCSSEFAGSLVKDPQAVTILTDLYDRQYNEGEWKNRLKSGNERLESPTLTILGGANDSQFRDVLLQRDITGGFLGRVFLIAEDSRKTLNPLLSDSDKDEDEIDLDAFIQYLKSLSKLKGQFSIDEEARAYYKWWYVQFYEKNGNKRDETGTLLRMGDKVLKIAMIVSLMFTSKLRITTDHIDLAIKACEPTLRSALLVSQGQGESNMAAKSSIVVTELGKAEGHKISRSLLLKRHWNNFTGSELDEIISTLESAGILKVSRDADTGTAILQLSKRSIRELDELQKGTRED